MMDTPEGDEPIEIVVIFRYEEMPGEYYFRNGKRNMALSSELLK